ncbi:SCF ubiquitin ligase complex subunit cdc4 [Paramarasmius palmivorus]|uniref:SCF ubiquitin ligase complex subunit cdc4 n=1 Tax=Paramarasmius palmivorus TaxID=297713 RepID=A0AAW0CQC5_9AGAR
MSAPNTYPKHISIPAHGHSVVTCLLFALVPSKGHRIISASDDHTIHVHDPQTAELEMSLEGHEGGIWALGAREGMLVSGSTDRTVRVWDLENGKCTHIFGGHTSTVRCLAVVDPAEVDKDIGEDSTKAEERLNRPLIVSGSRDHSLRVWSFPGKNDQEYKSIDGENDEYSQNTDDNPYHLHHLEGHDDAVRALAARGRTAVSGSYDYTVRVWDIIDGVCRWVLTGHTQKVYTVVLDSTRNQTMSGSMDGTIRIWSLTEGTCICVLLGHTSLVGLLGLSPSYLVSGAADATLRVWNPDTGEVKHVLTAHTGAITCFQNDDTKIVSGGDETLKVWDLKGDASSAGGDEDGMLPSKDLLSGITNVWQVAFHGRWCVAASNKADGTVLDFWDFGKEDWGYHDVPV